MAVKQTGKASELRDAVEAVDAFYSLAEGVARREEMNDKMRAELDKIARFLRPDNAEDFAEMIQWRNQTRTAGFFPGVGSGAPRMTRPKPVKWDKHSKGQGVKKEVSWSANSAGMRLRIERKKTGDQGVVFLGSIDDKVVTHGKLLKQAQTALEDEAYRRQSR